MKRWWCRRFGHGEWIGDPLHEALRCSRCGITGKELMRDLGLTGGRPVRVRFSPVGLWLRVEAGLWFAAAACYFGTVVSYAAGLESDGFWWFVSMLASMLAAGIIGLWRTKEDR